MKQINLKVFRTMKNNKRNRIMLIIIVTVAIVIILNYTLVSNYFSKDELNKFYIDEKEPKSSSHGSLAYFGRGNNSIIVDPIFKNSKPGEIAENVMLSVHGTSILKDSNYTENWTDGKTIKDFRNVAGLDQYYYFAIDSQYDHHMHEYTPFVMIEGNSTMGCINLVYSNWDATGDNNPSENSEQIKSYIISIIDSIGLTINGYEKIGISQADNLGLWQISVYQTYNNETLYPMSWSQMACIKSTIHFGKEVRYFSILYWIDITLKLIPTSRNDVNNSALDYFQQEFPNENYSNFNLYPGVYINNITIFYEGSYDIKQNNTEYRRTIKIGAVDGKIIEVRKHRLYYR